MVRATRSTTRAAEMQEEISRLRIENQRISDIIRDLQLERSNTSARTRKLQVDEAAIKEARNPLEENRMHHDAFCEVAKEAFNRFLSTDDKEERLA
ncbi:hypothetical protein N0V90_001192 [Kalmusia sp. IMI 367209]|nr:hypothetical protein N0V90_001192 [Kalmusia sp. IMI 367209]